MEDQGYLVDVSRFNLADSLSDTSFVIVRGSAKVFDYSTFQNIAQNEKQLDKAFPAPQEGSNRQQRRKTPKKDNKNNVFGDIKILVDVFFKNAIQVRLTNQHGISFTGPLLREHLREDIYNLIFKYGSKFQGEWVMLAGVSRVSSNPSLSTEVQFSREMLGDLEESDVQTGSDVLNQVLDMMNSLQEFVSSAAYPDVTVSPIAVYREISPQGS